MPSKLFREAVRTEADRRYGADGWVVVSVSFSLSGSLGDCEMLRVHNPRAARANGSANGKAARNGKPKPAVAATADSA